MPLKIKTTTPANTIVDSFSNGKKLFTLERETKKFFMRDSNQIDILFLPVFSKCEE